MDNVIETIAAWPWAWIGVTGLVWIPLAYLAICRLVRWVRARRRPKPVELAGAPTYRKGKWAGDITVSWGKPQVSAGDVTPVMSEWVHDPQPRPTEKSAPYVLDTSREIRELHERVEKLERGGAAGDVRAWKTDDTDCRFLFDNGRSLHRDSKGVWRESWVTPWMLDAKELGAREAEVLAEEARRRYKPTNPV